MSPSPVAWRLGRAARLLIPLLIVCLLPLLILNSVGPTLRVGIVNVDKGATVTLPTGQSQFVPFGRQLSAALLDTQERSGATVELLTIDTATHRFDEGALDALVIIPEDFSDHLATFGTTRARHAHIELHIRSSLNRSTQALASYIEETARHNLRTTLTENLLGGIYDGLDTLKDGMQQASKGSEDLASGTAQAARGISQLHAGAQQLTDGLEQFSAGVADLNAGAGALAEGSSELNGGIGQLSDGAQQLSAGISDLADGLTGTATQPGLMPGVNALTDGVLGTEKSPGLVQGTRQLAEGNRRLANGVEAIFSVMDPLRHLIPPPDAHEGSRIDLVEMIAHSRALAQAALDALDAGAGIVDSPESIASLKEALRQLVDQCPADEQEFCTQLKALVGQMNDYLDTLPDVHQQSRQALENFLTQTGTPEFSERLRAAQEILDAHGGIYGLIYGPQGAFSQLDALRSGTRQLAEGAELIADRVGGTDKEPGLAQGITQLRDGVEQLQQGVTGRNRYGEIVHSTHLLGGATQLADGFSRASAGAAAFDDGMQRFRNGTNEAANGAHSLTEGARQLRGGSADAADGLGRLHEGTQQLSRGLKDGEESIPYYSPSERKRIITVALSPVSLAHENEAAGVSTPSGEVIRGAQISILVIVMWVVGAVVLLRTNPFSATQLTRPITAAQVALHSLRGPLIIGVALAIVSLLALWGIQPVRPPHVAGSSPLWTGVASTLTVLIGVISIMVIHQGIMAVSGRRNGPGVVIVTLTIQLIPLVTSSLFQGNASEESWVGWSPLGALVRALQAAYYHDGAGQWAGALFILIVWALGTFIVSILSVNHYRSENERAALLETLQHHAV